MSYGGYSNGCTEYAVPEICEPMTWYCDGWCQEACKEGWSLTWEWDQEAANNGDWENASVPVCEKCPKGFNYFVWAGQEGRICASGTEPEKHEKPDALRNDWGYDWCEWPAQMDWEHGGCWEYSCKSGGDPTWGQDGRNNDYVQVCLDQERKDLECPPGMGEMSIWEEGETMNQWGYYDWVEVTYCVKTRPMKSLKTPRHDLHKVFHYYDWIVKDETEMEADHIEEEATTEDFDTTDGEWVEKTAEPTVYENDEEYLLTPIAGENFDDLNEHDTIDTYQWEEEHKDIDPNLYVDSGMMYDMADGTLDDAGHDSGMYDTAGSDWGYDSGSTGDYWVDSGMDYAGADTWSDSGMYDTAGSDWGYDSGADTWSDSGMYDTYVDSGMYHDSGADTYVDSGMYDTAYDMGYDSGASTVDTYVDSGMYDTASTVDTSAGYGSGMPTKRHHKHNRHH